MEGGGRRAEVEGGGWRGGGVEVEVEGGGGGWSGGGGWRWIFIILHSVALQSFEDVVDERLLGCDGGLEIGNLVF